MTELVIATADICPHGTSSSLCEWCGYKATSERRLEMIKEVTAKWVKVQGEAYELETKLEKQAAVIECHEDQRTAVIHQHAQIISELKHEIERLRGDKAFLCSGVR